MEDDNDKKRGDEMIPIVPLAVGGVAKAVEVALAGAAAASVSAGRMLEKKLDDNMKDESLSATSKEEMKEEQTMETNRNLNVEQVNRATESQTVGNPKLDMKQGKIMPSSKSPKFIAVRLEIFAAVLANEGETDFLEFPSADKLFKNVCGEFFKEFMGGLRPGVLASDDEWRETAFCEFQKSYPDGVRKTGAVWVRTKLPSPNPRQAINNKMFDYVEAIVFAGKTPLEEIDYDLIARKFGSSRQYALLYAAVANRNKILNTPGEGKAKPGSLVAIAQDSGNNDELSDKGAESGVEARGDRSFSGRSKFFVGVVKEKGTSLLWKINSYVVTDAITIFAGGTKPSPCPDISIADGLMLLNDGEFVVGIYKDKNSCLSFNQTVDAAVQVVGWASFKEAETEQSAEKYFSRNSSGVLTATSPFLLGNLRKHGHVIVVDESTYLKGFSSMGNGEVVYSDVEKYSGDFLETVAKYNQGTEFVYKNETVAILVPPPNNPYRLEGKHSVIDYAGWEPLKKSNPTLNAPETHPDDVGPDVVEREMVQTKTMTDSGETMRIEQMESNGVEPPRFSNPRSCDCEWDATEMKFLSDFNKYVRDCGFNYAPADLVRLHTSVKCSMCTLLAGNPGTGKSSLAELYMRAVAGSPEKDEAVQSWRKIFVNPAWMEPADLLGYETETEKDGFRHAPSRLAEFIRKISEGDRLPMGIVCFEEMNLAYVEHYFSDFIQLMGQGRGVVPGCKEKDKDLCVKPNFRVIGTCNSDETTRPLSPRFLSRCNTIELSSSFATTKSLVADLVNGKIPEIRPFNDGEPQTYENFDDWCKSSDVRSSIDDGIVNAILSLLEPKDGDESIMSSAGLDMSGRIVTDMFKYIRNRPPYKEEGVVLSELDRQRVALDEFLAQRVFFVCRPTHGTIVAIRELFDTVNNGLNFKVEGKGNQGVSTQRLELPLSASLLRRRIRDYNKRIAQG